MSSQALHGSDQPDDTDPPVFGDIIFDGDGHPHRIVAVRHIECDDHDPSCGGYYNVFTMQISWAIA
jgi:hypothetical protein